MTMLAGKRALIVGLLSDRSIAYGIAESMHKAGAKLAFTYQGDKVKDRVEKMARTFEAEIIAPCDVTDDAQIEGVFNEIEAKWGNVDIIVHSVAFAPQAELEGDYAENLTREGFRVAMDVSAYSLGALAKAGLV